MSDRGDKEIVKALDELDAIELANLEEFGKYVGEPDSHQKKILLELGRLHHSLRGPEWLLDKGSYSRPIPPRNAVTKPRSKAVAGQEQL